MIKERYVNLEVAKLLRDKGFDEECIKTYNISNGQRYTGSETCNSEFINLSGMVTAPTQAVVCDWVEAKYNISIDLYIGRYGYLITVSYALKIPEFSGEMIYRADMPKGDNIDGSWSDKERAYNDMLKYVLTKLI